MPFGTVKAQTYLSFKDAITPIAPSQTWKCLNPDPNE